MFSSLYIGFYEKCSENHMNLGQHSVCIWSSAKLFLTYRDAMTVLSLTALTEVLKIEGSVSLVELIHLLLGLPLADAFNFS